MNLSVMKLNHKKIREFSFVNFCSLYVDKWFSNILGTTMQTIRSSQECVINSKWTFTPLQ